MGDRGNLTVPRPNAAVTTATTGCVEDQSSGCQK